ncbi:LuxR C-terminal-related transcriptional regulator [Pseudoxanthomonas beigongshangi]|uniref:LuxR C-terminal-related transcriptional regulator n=1 Tax=Pseudoxanthomonas beigongshangi TaxID=2782537 RepID=UPI00193BA5E5|nr:LuxR C-terminal-related transcriptional regulator [Pseudoxanthomonas beigongshangi]
MREGDDTSDIRIGTRGLLTRREAEAVLWIALGKTSWEAGRILGVAEGTMNVHVANASAKLGLPTGRTLSRVLLQRVFWRAEDSIRLGHVRGHGGKGERE